MMLIKVCPLQTYCLQGYASQYDKNVGRVPFVWATQAVCGVNPAFLFEMVGLQSLKMVLKTVRSSLRPSILGRALTTFLLSPYWMVPTRLGCRRYILGQASERNLQMDEPGNDNDLMSPAAIDGAGLLPGPET
jgi:hypothetical protein